MSRTASEPADRLLTIRELAGYLAINDRTLLKLVTEGKLPGVKVGGQWRFRRTTIDTWLDDQMLGVTPRYLEPRTQGAASSPVLLELRTCFEPGHVVPELAATRKTTVVEELAAHAQRLGLVRDKTWFTGALIERENVMPTAMGNGIAFLHTLRRHPEQVVRPFMVLGRSPRGVAFEAMNRKPTHLFFVLGLKYQELHLPWLAKLARMLARPKAVRELLAAPDGEAIYRVLAEAERRLG